MPDCRNPKAAVCKRDRYRKKFSGIAGRFYSHPKTCSFRRPKPARQLPAYSRKTGS
jgi:hypothetical protein